MVWTVVGYLLSLYVDKYNTDIVELGKLTRLVFEKLWAEHNLALVDSPEELLEYLKYFEKLGIVRINRDKIVILDRNRLEKLRRVVEHSPLILKPDLYEDMINRIYRGIEEV